MKRWRSVAVTVLLQASFSLSAIYITDTGSRKVLELNSMGEPCKMMSDRSSISNMIRRVDSRYIQRMHLRELDDLAQRCRDVEGVHKRGGFLYPGTKWCGPGNSAQGYNDLGAKTAEDQCCREHDHCTNVLEPGQCRQSICNVSPFTRSHCNCDNAFKRCLHNVNSNAANTIGVLYFNVAQVTCFRERRDCPPFMKADSSYTWFCDEWKFVPTDKYEPSESAAVSGENATRYNEIPEEPRSKIDDDLERLYRKEPSIEHIMDGRRFRRGSSRAGFIRRDTFLPKGRVWRN